MKSVLSIIVILLLFASSIPVDLANGQPVLDSTITNGGRKFADDHRHVPLKDLADLGGWETPRTILEVYQGSNLDAMRQAQQCRRGVGEKAASGE